MNLRLVVCPTKEKWLDYSWINSLSFIPRSTTCHFRKINNSRIPDHDITEINNVTFLPSDRHNNIVCGKMESCNRNSISRRIDEHWKDSVNVRRLIVTGKSYRTHPWASFDDAKNLWASRLHHSSAELNGCFWSQMMDRSSFLTHSQAKSNGSGTRRNWKKRKNTLMPRKRVKDGRYKPHDLVSYSVGPSSSICEHHVSSLCDCSLCRSDSVLTPKCRGKCRICLFFQYQGLLVLLVLCALLAGIYLLFYFQVSSEKNGSWCICDIIWGPLIFPRLMTAIGTAKSPQTLEIDKLLKLESDEPASCSATNWKESVQSGTEHINQGRFLKVLDPPLSRAQGQVTWGVGNGKFHWVVVQHLVTWPNSFCYFVCELGRTLPFWLVIFWMFPAISNFVASHQLIWNIKNKNMFSTKHKLFVSCSQTW